MRFYLIIFYLFFYAAFATSQTLTGADVLFQSDFSLLHGKSVGLITNSAATNRSNQSLVSALKRHPKVNLFALFSPEHGFLVNQAAGDIVVDQNLFSTDIPVYSLYGKNRKPTKTMLKNIDVLLFDIQDIGTRFYTYTSTLALSLEAANENGIQYIVLDRPNPISALGCDGPVLDKALFSFIGMVPIPIMHGLTIGEFAQMLIGEKWINLADDSQLSVVKMEDWHHGMFYEDSEITWIPPSPNIPFLETALVYPGMGLLEATNISEGRGTISPFTIIGAPWIDNNYIVENLKYPGILLGPLQFTPKDIVGKAINPKFEDTLCNGIKLEILNRKLFKPVEFAIHLICILRDVFPNQFELDSSRMEKMLGSKKLVDMVKNGECPDKIIKSYQEDLNGYKIIRNKYLLYSD